MAYDDTNGVSAERSSRSSIESMDVDELRRRIQGLQDDVARADQRLRVLARERPFVAVGLAVAAGFLLGRAFGRS